MADIFSLSDDLLLVVLMYFITLPTGFAQNPWPAVQHPFSIRMCRTAPSLITGLRRKYILSHVCRRFRSLLSHVTEATLCAFVMQNVIISTPGVAMLLPPQFEDIFHASIVPYFSGILVDVSLMPFTFCGLRDVRIQTEDTDFHTTCEVLSTIQALHVFHFKHEGFSVVDISEVVAGLVSLKQLVEFGLQITCIRNRTETNDMEVDVSHIKRWILNVREGADVVLSIVNMYAIQHLGLPMETFDAPLPMKLYSLDLSSSTGNVDIFRVQKECPYLKYLNLQYVASDFGYDPVFEPYHQNFDALRAMNLLGLNLNGWRWSCLVQAVRANAFSGLIHLSLANLGTSIGQPLTNNVLQGCTFLRLLDISGNFVEFSPKMPRLQQLIAVHLKSGSRLSFVRELVPQLTVVDLSENSVAYTTKEDLLLLPSLRVLILRACNVPFADNSGFAVPNRRHIEGRVLPVYYRMVFPHVFVVC